MLQFDKNTNGILSLLMLCTVSCRASRSPASLRMTTPSVWSAGSRPSRLMAERSLQTTSIFQRSTASMPSATSMNGSPWHVSAPLPWPSFAVPTRRSRRPSSTTSPISTQSVRTSIPATSLPQRPSLYV
jgi:hypothetical protein